MAMDEENVRIFYSVYYTCAGADKTEREKFSVIEAQDYYYANQTDVLELPGVNSRFMYIELKGTLGTAPPLMSGILWLIDTGNNANTNTNSNTSGESQQQFQQGDKLNPPKCPVKDSNVLMLDVDPSDLALVLLTRENKIHGETFITPLSVEEARNDRDTFERIVTKLNDTNWS